MLKWTTATLATLAVVGGCLALLQALAPTEFQVERSVDIAAPPALVFTELNDLHHWQAWSPWGVRNDPQVKTTWEGAPAGMGAKASWAGNDAVGEGSISLDESQPPARLGLSFTLVRPEDATYDSSVTLTPDPNAPANTAPRTRVVWSLHGTHTAWGRMQSWVHKPDSQWGPPLESALAALQQICEDKVRTRVPINIPGTPGAPVLSVLRDETGGCGWWRMQGSGRRTLAHFDGPCKEVVSLSVSSDQEQGLALTNGQAPAVFTVSFSDSTATALPLLPMHRGETALAAQYSGESQLPSLLTWALAPPEDQPGGGLKVGKWRRYVFSAKGWQLSNTLVEEPEDLQGSTAGAAQADFYADGTYVPQVDLEEATRRGADLKKQMPAMSTVCTDPNASLLAFNAAAEAPADALALCVAVPDAGFLHSTGEGALLPAGAAAQPFKLPGMGRSLLRFWNFQAQGRYALTCKHGAWVWDLQGNAGIAPLAEGEGILASLWPFDKCLE